MNEEFSGEFKLDRPHSERLNEIFKIIMEAEPASSFVEMEHLLESAFDEVEKNENNKMSVKRAEGLIPIETKDAKIIYVQSYNKHIVLLGENGAIEIREKPDLDIPMMWKDEEEIKQLKPALIKLGKNGKDVWGD